MSVTSSSQTVDRSTSYGRPAPFEDGGVLFQMHSAITDLYGGDPHDLETLPRLDEAQRRKANALFKWRRHRLIRDRLPAEIRTLALEAIDELNARRPAA
ncbi:hypothetical protein DYI37_04035 [Fulvimarina endophytica]|uniref:Uncharacterized protein n=1 Tax=Fulvimarina endophytica TaxID=2293836 RepID=A0A371X7K0_9HYPH|nr:hypothetical protein [Fulvimarina endophytica]RFC65044.1 hypothetical protein DYI37_04035 [Fulvimarina endophytica]